jgi:hypothetical protein
MQVTTTYFRKRGLRIHGNPEVIGTQLAINEEELRRRTAAKLSL